MRSLIRNLIIVMPIFCSSHFTYAAEVASNSFAAKEEKSPLNSCQFVSADDDFKLAITTKTTPIMNDYDNINDTTACPSDDVIKCPIRDKVNAQTKLLISKKYEHFYCAYNPENDNSGWIDEKALVIQPTRDPSAEDWIGTWVSRENIIKISATDDNKLKAIGNAFLNKGTDSLRTGYMEISGDPNAKRWKDDIPVDYPDQCGVDILIVSPYLLVNDNLHCGGANVTFNGVYKRGYGEIYIED